MGLSVIPQDVVIASRPRNKNHSSLKIFHSFLIMKYLFFAFHSINKKILGKRVFIMQWLVTPWIDELIGIKISSPVGFRRDSLVLSMFWLVTLSKETYGNFCLQEFTIRWWTYNRRTDRTFDGWIVLLRTLFDRTVDILSWNSVNNVSH